MRKLMAAMTGMLIALAGGAPATAQQSGNVSFSVGGVNFTAPVPAGYCSPTGPQIESAQSAEAFDKNNVTNLTLDSCGPGANRADYLIVKTPIDLVSTPMRLQDLLRDPVFARPGGPEAPPGAEQAMEASASERRGEPVNVSGGVAGLGHDDVCGYLGGTIAAAASGKTEFYSTGGCMTVVGGRVLSVFFYAPGNAHGTVTRLRAKARAFALSISVRKG